MIAMAMSKADALDAAFLAGYNYAAKMILDDLESGAIRRGDKWRKRSSLGKVVIKRIPTHPRNKKY